MGTFNFSGGRGADEPLGPYRDKRTVLVGTDDIVIDSGFTCQVQSGGNITYRALGGQADVTETGLTAGDTIVGPGNVPVILSAIRGASTITSVVIGIL